VSARHIERATRSWGSDLDRAILATALIGNRLSSAGRDDLAAVATFALARTGAVAASDGADPTPSFETSRALFRTYASRLLESIEHCVENPTAFLDLGDEVIPVVGYSVRCSLVVEAAGLLGLLLFDEDTPDDAKKVADLLARFVSSQPGAARPLSDRWAVSLAPAAALLRRCESDALIPWMERVIVWICDRYADGGGLASVAADERREIEQLLGYPLAHLDVKDRRSSYVATVVLDVSCALELPGLFQDAINDFKAVEIARPSLEPLDEPGNFGFDGRGLKFEANVAYDEGNNFDTSWRAGVHHKRCPADYVLQRSGRNWELLAIQALLRDRLFLPAIREAAGLEVPATH
jgi:hypothetical protein